MVLPVIAWFGAQVVAPDLVKRALDLLSQPDWRKNLVASVKRRSERKFSRRRLTKWLTRKDVWELLVNPSDESTATLTKSLTGVLATRHQPAARQADLAEYLVRLVYAEFLANLDASYAVSISHYQQTAQLTRIEDRLADQNGFATNLACLPPPVARTISSEMANGSGACERLAAHLADPASREAGVVRDLVDAPPAWLQGGPAPLWAALGEIRGQLRLVRPRLDLFRARC